jgi:hypothetical protein
MILWKLIKDRLYKEGKITDSGMHFDIDSDYNDSDNEEYTEKDLIDDFMKIYKERMNTKNI